MWVPMRGQTPGAVLVASVIRAQGITTILIISKVTSYQRPRCTESLDDPVLHECIPIQERAYLCIIYVWRYKDYSACEIA